MIKIYWEYPQVSICPSMFFMERSIFTLMRILLLALDTTKLYARQIHFNFYKTIEIIQSWTEVGIFTTFTDFIFLCLILAVIAILFWEWRCHVTKTKRRNSYEENMIHKNVFPYTIIVDVKNIQNSAEKWRRKSSFVSFNL